MVGICSGEKGRAGKASGVVLYVMEELEYMKFTVGNGIVEHLWARIKGQTKNAMSLWKSAEDYLARTITLKNYSLRN